MFEVDYAIKVEMSTRGKYRRSPAKIEMMFLVGGDLIFIIDREDDQDGGRRSSERGAGFLPENVMYSASPFGGCAGSNRLRPLKRHDGGGLGAAF